MSLLWVIYVMDIKMFSDLNTEFVNNIIDLLENPNIKHMETVMGHTVIQILAGFIIGIIAIIVML